MSSHIPKKGSSVKNLASNSKNFLFERVFSSKDFFLIIAFALLVVYVYALTKPKFTFPGLENRIFPFLLIFSVISFILYFPWGFLSKKIESIRPTHKTKSKVTAFFSSLHDFQQNFSLSTVKKALENEKTKALTKYSFLLFLTLTIISSLKFDFLTPVTTIFAPHQSMLFILAILTGIITFWQNKQVIEKVEQEQNEEQRAEQKKAEEFDKRYSRLSKVPVINRIAKWAYKEGLTFSIGLFVLVVLYFIFNLSIGLTANVDLDEGQLIYDAHLLNGGNMPFIDFTTRAPILVYSLATIENVFGGHSIFNSKLLISLLFTVGLIFFYLCVKELINDKKISLVSTIFFAFIPNIFYYSYVLHVAQSILPIVLIYTYLMLKYQKLYLKKYIILFAIVLAIGYFIRRDIIILVVPTLILIYFWNKNEFSSKIFDTFLYFLVMGAVFFILAIPFINTIGIVEFDKFYGIQSLISSTTLGEGLSSTNINNPYLFFSWFILWLPYLLVFTFVFFQKFFKKNKFIAELLTIILFSIILIYGLFNIHGTTGSFDFLNSNFLYIHLIMTGSIVCLLYINQSKNLNIKNPNFILIAPLIILTTLFVLGVNLSASYFLVPSTFIGLLSIPLIISYFFKSKSSKIMKFLFILIFLFLLLQNNYFVFSQLTHERGYSQEIINRTSISISDLNLTKKVFTVDTTLVINSDFEIVPEITHHRVYDGIDCLPFDELNLPCLSKIKNVLVDENVSVIVMGFRTYEFVNRDSELLKFIKDNFEKIKTVKSFNQSADILIRK